MKRCAVVLALASASGAGAAETAPVEDQIARFVDARQEQSIALLQRLVDINSGSLNFEGVRAVADLLRAELDALGFETRWVPGASFERAGHLVAERSGSGPRLLLIGHLDTVFEEDSPFQRFQRIDAGTAAGPGVVDMKGGNIVTLQALKALHAEGDLEGTTITGC